MTCRAGANGLALICIKRVGFSSLVLCAAPAVPQCLSRAGPRYSVPQGSSRG